MLNLARPTTLAYLLRFHRTYGPYHFFLPYLPLSQSTFPLSYTDTSDCLIHIPYLPITSSTIDPCTIKWRFAYHLIRVVAAIMYDTSTHKVVVLKA